MSDKTKSSLNLSNFHIRVQSVHIQFKQSKLCGMFRFQIIFVGQYLVEYSMEVFLDGF